MRAAVSKNSTTLLGVGLVATWLFGAPAWAVKVDDVKCKKCVQSKEIGKKALKNEHFPKNAIDGSRIKDGSLGESRFKSVALEQLTIGDFYVVDANGKVVGPMLEMENVLLRGEDQRIISTRVRKNQLQSHDDADRVYYTEANCTGEIYLSLDEDDEQSEFRIVDHAAVGNDASGNLTAFAHDFSGVRIDNLAHKSVWEIDDKCENNEGEIDGAVRAIPEVDLTDFVPPFSVVPVLEASP